MPQKPLKVKKTATLKKMAANLHGKASRTTTKGKMSKPPKRQLLVKQHTEATELTKLINAKNEGQAAGKASTGGGQLQIVKPPPVLASAFQKKKGRGADAKSNDTKSKDTKSKDTAAPMES